MAAGIPEGLTRANIGAVDSVFAPTLESVNRTSPQGLSQLNALASDVFATHPAFSESRTILGKSKNAQAKVIKAVNGHDFPGKKTTPPEQYSALFEAASAKEELSRRLILEEIEGGAEFGLKRFELDVVKASCEVGSVYDELNMQWREDVPNNPTNEQALALGFTDRYTVITGNAEDGFKETPWVERYPDHVTKIASKWRALSAQLATYTEEAEAQALAVYYGTYADAMEAKVTGDAYDAEEVAEMWRNVDRAWMYVQGRVQPIATREYGYYDKNGIRVVPDYRLAIVQDVAEDELAATRSNMQEYMADRYGDTRVYKTTINALDNVNVFPAFDAVFAGTQDFQPAGQSLPNELPVQDELGSKVMVNPESTGRRWKLALELARNVFSGDDLKEFDKVDSDMDMAIRYVGGHEFAEPLFQPTDVHKGLGERITSLLNEDLANDCATVTIGWRAAKGELKEDEVIRHGISLLGTYLRLIDSGRDAEHLQPYYVGHALQGLRRMIATGFIDQDEAGQWHLHTDRIHELIDANSRDLDTLVQIGESLDVNAAQQYLALAQETPQIRDIIKKVNPKAKFK